MGAPDGAGANPPDPSTRSTAAAKPVGCGVLLSFILGALVATGLVQIIASRFVEINFASRVGTVSGVFLLINLVAAGIAKGRIPRSRRALQVTLAVVAVEVVLAIGIGIVLAVGESGHPADPTATGAVRSVVASPTAGGLVRIDNPETQGRAASTVDGLRRRGFIEPLAASYGPANTTEPTVTVLGGRIAPPSAGGLGLAIKGAADGSGAIAVGERTYDTGSLSGEVRCAQLSREGSDLNAVCVWGDGSTIVTVLALDQASPPELARTVVGMLPDMGAAGPR